MIYQVRNSARASPRSRKPPKDRISNDLEVTYVAFYEIIRMVSLWSRPLENTEDAAGLASMLTLVKCQI